MHLESAAACRKVYLYQKSTFQVEHVMGLRRCRAWTKLRHPYVRQNTNTISISISMSQCSHARDMAFRLTLQVCASAHKFYGTWPKLDPKFNSTTTPRRNQLQGIIHLAPCINRITDMSSDGFRKEARSDRQEASVKNFPLSSISNLDIKLT